MKYYFLIFDNCCFYEIVILSYFMKFTGLDVKFCTMGEEEIGAMEGFRVKADVFLKDIEVETTGGFIIPGGEVENVRSLELEGFLKRLKADGKLLGAICAGVDLLDEYGILENVRSTHLDEADCIVDGTIVTARANGYVDFAIEVGKVLELFQDEADLKETIDFFKYQKQIP